MLCIIEIIHLPIKLPVGVANIQYLYQSSAVADQGGGQGGQGRHDL